VCKFVLACIHVCLCTSVRLCICASVHLGVFAYVSTCVCVYVCVCVCTQPNDDGGAPNQMKIQVQSGDDTSDALKLQFCKRSTNHRDLLRKMAYTDLLRRIAYKEDKASYVSAPPCSTNPPTTPAPLPPPTCVCTQGVIINIQASPRNFSSHQREMRDFRVIDPAPFLILQAPFLILQAPSTLKTLQDLSSEKGGGGGGGGGLEGECFFFWVVSPPALFGGDI